MTDAEEADRLSRRRAGMMPMLGVLLIVQQGIFFTTDDRGRLVDQVRTTGWLALAAVILAALVTGGFWFKRRAVRDLMDDDVTRANRASAVTLGFVFAISAAIVLYALEAFVPGSATTLEAIHIIVTAGLFAALLRFGYLERRALG
jgi:uncharacterized membrane protein